MAWRRRISEQPVIPLLFLLLCLVILLFVIQPGFLGRPTNWLSSTIRTATPLALLAACQTLVMLTGGIDLSVATVATMAAFVMATQSAGQGDAVAVLLGIFVGACMGLLNGIGIGIFRVQPLIMTLGTGLVGAGLLTVYQKFVLTAGSSVPDPIAWLGGGTSFGFLPNSLLLFVPVAALILFGLRRTGYGRMLFAVGDNPIAARLAGVRIWQVLIVVYVLSGHPRGDRRHHARGRDQDGRPWQCRRPAAAVGGRGRHRRHLHLRWPRWLCRAASSAPSS